MKNKYLHLLLFILIIFIFSVNSSADIKPNEDLDNDGYDFNDDGEIDQDEKFTNIEEYENGTDPNDPDSDNDTMIDGWEVEFGLNPLWDDSLNDTDNDGLTNLDEWNFSINPSKNDTDGDGILDKWEIDNGLDPKIDDSSEDQDNDGLTNLEEFQIGTNPNDEDTDNDGLKDGDDPYPLIPANNRKIVMDTGFTNINVDVYSIFEPSLNQMKRGAVVDAVSVEDRNYTIFVNNTSKNQLEFAYGGFDFVFDGIWEIQVNENFTPIPSVTPDNKLLRYFSEKKIEFFKDKTDNLYVRSNETNTIYLAYNLVTNGTYFNLEVPDNLIVANKTSNNDIPDGVWIQPNNEISKKVDWFLNNSKEEKISNLKNETNFTKILNNLTTYFSEFTSGDIPDANETHDVYQTIVINKIGASWHRSFGFFVTANSLGIPTRFVQEPRIDEKSQKRAKAFVEVYIPKKSEEYNLSRWKKIDLGYNENLIEKDVKPEKNGKLISNITIINHPLTANKTKSFWVYGNVTEQDGEPLPYLPISLFLNTTRTYLVNYSRTDENGEFNITCEIPDSIHPGMINISAKSNRTYIYNEFWNFSNIKILSNTTINLETSNSVGKGNKLNVIGYLNDITNLGIINEKINFYWDKNFINQTYTNEFGEFDNIYNIKSDEKSGIHYLNVTFNGTEFLDNSIFSKIINVKQGIFLNSTLNATKITIGENFTVNGNLTNETGKSMGGTGNIIIILYGNVLRNVSLSGENFSIECTVPFNVPSGNHSVLIKYVPNSENKDKYPEASVIRNLNILGIKTKIELYSMNAVRGEIVNIEGIVLDINNNPVDFEKVALKWNETWIGESSTNADGEFTYNYLVPNDEGLGDLNVTGIFNETDEYKSSSNYANYTVFSNTIITLDLNPLSTQEIYRNSTIYLNGTLTDNLGNKLDGRDINLWFDLGYFDSDTTDGNGNFSFQYFVDKEHDLGLLGFSFKYDGDGLFLETERNANYKIWAKTFINISGAPIVATVGDNILIKGKLKDDMGNHLEEIIFLKLGFSTKTANSNNGNFSFNLTIIQNEIAQNHTFSVEFKGSGYYKTSIDSRIITIRRTTNISFDISEFSYRNKTLEIKGDLIDNMGTGLKDKNVDIFLNNKYIGNDKTENSGQFSINYFINYTQSLGTLNITGKFNETEFYTYSNENDSIDIMAEIEFIFPTENIFRNSNIKINGTIIEKEERLLQNIPIKLHWNGSYIGKNTTDENGDFSIKYFIESNYPLGKFNVTVELNSSLIETKYYSQTNLIIQFNVISNTTINISQVKNLTIGENITIFGNLTDDLGIGLNESIDIIFDSELIKTIETNNGNIQTNWPIPLNTKADNHNLTISLRKYFPKDDGVFYNYSNDTIIIPIQRYSNIKITDYSSLSLRNNSVFINGTLTDNLAENIENEKIDFYWDNGKYLGNISTEIDGSYSFNFTVPLNQNLGIINFTVQFNETKFYKNSSITKNFTIISGTKISIVEINQWLSVGDYLYVNGTLTDDLNNILNREIEIFFNEISTGNITPIDGNFSFDMEITKKIKSGNYTLDLRLKNIYPNGNYLFSNESRIITVQIDTNISLYPSSIFRNETNNIEGRLTDIAKNGVDALLVDFYIENKGEISYLGSNMTFNDGNFSLEFYNMEYLGLVNISAQFNGTQFFASSNITYYTKSIANITFIFPEKQVFRNESFIINGTILEGENRLKDLKIDIYWNNTKIGNDTTNEFGDFYKTYQENETLGFFNVSVVLDENIKDLEFYNINRTNILYFVIGNTFIDFSDEIVNRNDTINISGIITEGIEGFENLDVDLIWNGTLIDTIRTNSNGNFSMEYSIDKFHELENIEVTAKFNETNLNSSHFLVSSKTVNYQILAITKLNISFVKSSVIVGNKVKIYGNFSDDLDKILEKNIFLRFLDQQKTLTPETLEFNWTFDVPLDTKAQIHILSVDFYKDGFYDESSDSKEIYVKRLSNIFLSPDSVNRGERVTITGKLLDNINEGIIENVTIEWNGTILGKTKTDENGNIKYDLWDNISIGQVEVKATLEDSNFYTNSFNSTNFTVFANTTIFVYPKIVFRNKTFEINGTIMENNELLTKFLPLNVTWNDTLLYTKTDENGNFSIEHKVDKDFQLADIDVIIEINGSQVNLSLFSEKQNATTYSIVSETIMTMLTISKGSIAKEFEVFANLTDEFGSGLNKYVNILLDKKMYVENVRTNNSGNFTITLKIPSDYEPDIYNISVEFEGDNHYLPTLIYKQIPFKYMTNIVLNSVNKHYRGGNISISGTLYQITQWPIGLNGQVDIFWNGELIGSNDTTDLGEFMLEYNVEKNHSLGESEIFVAYNENADFSESNSTKNVEIWARTYMNLTDDFESNIVFRNDELIICGSVYEKSNPKENFSIDLFWNNTFQNNTITLSDGNFSLTYLINSTQQIGEFLLEIKFNDSDYYENPLKKRTYVIKRIIGLYLEPKVVVIDSIVNITGSFENPDEIENPIIEILWDGNLLGQTEIFGNTFYKRLNLTFSKYDKGFWNVTARFHKDSLYVNSVNSTFTILAKSAFYKLKITPDIGIVGDKLYIEGNLEEIQGTFNKPIKGNISIYIDNKIIKTLNVNGYFSTSFILDENILAGIHTLSIITSSFDKSLFANSSFSKEIAIKGNIMIDIGDFKSYRDKILKIEGTVVDNVGRQINGFLDLYWRNKFVKSVSVFEGNFSYEHEIPSNERLGNISFRVWFKGTDLYEDTNKTVNITILGKTSIFLYFPDKIYQNEKFQGQVLLNDEYGNGIPDMFVIVKYNDITIEVITGEDGRASFSATAISEFVNFSVVFNGNNYLEKSESKESVKSLLHPVEAEFQIFWLLIGLIIACAFGGAGTYYYFWKKKQPKKEVIEPLIKGETPIIITKRAYQKIIRSLRKYGFIRKKSQTFREFESEVTNNLDVDKQNLNKVTTTFEELVYSSHEITRKKANDVEKSSESVETSLKGNIAQKKRKKAKKQKIKKDIINNKKKK